MFLHRFLPHIVFLFFLLSWGTQVVNLFTLQKKGEKPLDYGGHKKKLITKEMVIFIVFLTSMKANKIFSLIIPSRDLIYK